MRDGRHGGIAKAKAACVYNSLNRRGQGSGVEEIALALKIGCASVYRVLSTAQRSWRFPAYGALLRSFPTPSPTSRGFEESESAEIGAYATLPKYQTAGDGRSTPESRRRPRRPCLPRWARRRLSHRKNNGALFDHLVGAAHANAGV